MAHVVVNVLFSLLYGATYTSEMTSALKSCKARDYMACTSLAYLLGDEGMPIFEETCRKAKFGAACTGLGFAYDKQGRKAEAIDLFFTACLQDVNQCPNTATMLAIPEYWSVAKPIMREWFMGYVREACGGKKPGSPQLCESFDKLVAVEAGKNPNETLCKEKNDCSAWADELYKSGKPLPDDVWKRFDAKCAETAKCGAMWYALRTPHRPSDKAWMALAAGCLKGDCQPTTELWKNGIWPSDATLTKMRRMLAEAFAPCEDVRKVCTTKLDGFDCQRARDACRFRHKYYSEGVVLPLDAGAALASYKLACPKANSSDEDKICRAAFPYVGKWRVYYNPPCAGESPMAALLGAIAQTGIEPRLRYKQAVELYELCREDKEGFRPPDCRVVPALFLRDMRDYMDKDKIDPPCKPDVNYTVTPLKANECYWRNIPSCIGQGPWVRAGPDEQKTRPGTCFGSEYTKWLDAEGERKKKLGERWKGPTVELCPAN